MYNAVLRFLFARCPDNFMEAARRVAPLPNFTHEFTDDLAKASLADVLFAGPDCGVADIEELAAQKKPGARICLLRGADWELPPKILEQIFTVWQLPLGGDALDFYFARLLQSIRMEFDLAQERQFLDCLLETTPNLVWFKRRDGIHERVSRAFCETVRKPRSDVEGYGHAHIWNVEHDDPACVESERIVMESGSTHVSGEEIETGEGTRRLKTFKAPLRNVDGTMMGTLGIGVDITMEQRYRESLLQNNAALDALFAGLDCGMLTQSLDGARLFGANRMALELLGVESLADLADGFGPIARTVVPEDREKLCQSISALKKAGESTSYEYRVRHADGSILHIMGTAKIVEQNGQLVCQRFLLDCTVRKEAQEREELERRRWQEALVRALCVDYQLVCVFDSPSGGEVLQLDAEPDEALAEIFSSSLSLGEKFASYARTRVHPDDRQAFLKNLALADLRAKLAHEKMHYFNYRVDLDGDIRYFQLKAVRGGLVKGDFSVVIGLQSVDAAVRHEMEQKELLRNALAQAKKASEAKSVFLSNMSHDIRTPMNAIAGYTALALNQLENREQVAGYLEKTASSCGHLISLINDILDMSHIESGKLQLEENSWNLPALLDELWGIVEPTAAAKRQDLSLKMVVPEPWIRCDKLRLNQILLNLLSNAVKYTQEGGKIVMEVAQKAGPGELLTCEFRVRDNGMGMSEDFLEKIFEPFERADACGSIQGTGLGMAITNRLVRLMGGTIEVRSKLNEGSEFVLAVPFRAGTPDAEAEMERPGARPGLPQGLDSCRVLLAEDNAMNQEIACEFLRSAGYEVEVAENGRAAVEMLCAAGPGHYDVILMDVQMPLLDGYGATSEIRSLADPALAKVPILAMTANSFEEDRQEALARGMDGHVAKPIDFGALFEILNRLLGAKPSS